MSKAVRASFWRSVKIKPSENRKSDRHWKRDDGNGSRFVPGQKHEGASAAPQEKARQWRNGDEEPGLQIPRPKQVDEFIGDKVPFLHAAFRSLKGIPPTQDNEGKRQNDKDRCPVDRRQKPEQHFN